MFLIDVGVVLVLTDRIRERMIMGIGIPIGCVSLGMLVHYLTTSGKDSTTADITSTSCYFLI